jgi:hypothetical protein
MTFDWTMQDAPERFTWVGQDGPVSVRLAFGPAAPILAVASVAMTVLGGVMQASAQQEAGETAYQNALQKSAMLNAEANNREAAAKQAQASKQREGIEANRKYVLAASRARAVMAAGGGGVDEGIIAGILSEGDYAKDVALYEGDETARGLQNQATMDRYSANTARQAGHNAREAAGRAAAMTLIGTAGKAGMSLAQMYAPGPAPVTPSSPEDAMSAWRALPVSQRAPGFSDGWGIPS